jgi:hypothetical protein
MNTYPFFEYDSIIRRCKADIDSFVLQQNCPDNIGISLRIDGQFSKENMDTIIAGILTKMMDFTLPTEENYVDKISSIEEENQKKLWIARTYLFYQLLIFATATFLSKNLYDIIYTDTNIFPYREDLTQDELKNFKMGIFGTMSPTSDIDIGIQYSGNTLKTPALAYIVSRFENLFLIFTKHSSLDYDIETYADMMTIPSVDENFKDQDYFYLDSGSFNESNYIAMLPFAYNSILRNLYLAGGEITENTTLGDIVNTFLSDNKDIQDKIVDEKIFDESKKTVNTFFSLDYNTQRYEYYTKVDVAEKMKFGFGQKIYNLDPSEISSLMGLIGDALTYRMESYTCAPTVIHVVRTMQASPDKYKTNTPDCIDKPKLKPFCVIGKFGYLLSILEQIGYMHRFYLSYCEGSHADPAKCSKKQEKYKKRLDDAIAKYEFLRESSASVDVSADLISGGRKKTRKLQKKTRTYKLQKTKRRQIKKRQKNVNKK